MLIKFGRESTFLALLLAGLSSGCSNDQSGKPSTVGGRPQGASADQPSSQTQVAFEKDATEGSREGLSLVPLSDWGWYTGGQCGYQQPTGANITGLGIQSCVDGAISTTVTCSYNVTYTSAQAAGQKGCPAGWAHASYAWALPLPPPSTIGKYSINPAYNPSCATIAANKKNYCSDALTLNHALNPAPGTSDVMGPSATSVINSAVAQFPGFWTQCNVHCYGPPGTDPPPTVN